MFHLKFFYLSTYMFFWKIEICLLYFVLGFKGGVMQIEKALINDRLRVSKVSWKFRIPTIYNFAGIHPWSLLFLKR